MYINMNKLFCIFILILILIVLLSLLYNLNNYDNYTKKGASLDHAQTDYAEWHENNHKSFFNHKKLNH